MFIVSMKMTKTKIIAGLSVLLVAGIFCAFMISAKGASTDVAKNSEKKITGLAAENNEQRINYLKQFGWEVKNEPSEIVEVAIPTEFNDVYEKYNVIQKKQGAPSAKSKMEDVFGNCEIIKKDKGYYILRSVKA